MSALQTKDVFNAIKSSRIEEGLAEKVWSRITSHCTGDETGEGVRKYIIVAGTTSLNSRFLLWSVTYNGVFALSFAEEMRLLNILWS